MTRTIPPQWMDKEMKMSDQTVLTCEEAIRRLASYLDGELEGETRAELESHLGRCRSCYSRHDFEKGLKRHLSDLGHAPVSPRFEERIRSLVTQFARGTHSN